MRSFILSLVVLSAAVACTALTPSPAVADGPYWARRPIYINGEWIGYTYNYPKYTDSRYAPPGGTVTLPPAYYTEPPIYVTPGYVAPGSNNGGYYDLWRGYYGNRIYYGR